MYMILTVLIAVRTLCAMQPRCHKYWPDIVGDSTEFGKITVALDELETFAEYTRRTMSVQIKVSNGPRVTARL